MTYVIGILLTAFMVWYAFHTRLSAKFVIIEVLSYIVGLLVGLGCCYEFGWNPGIGIIVAAVVCFLVLGNALNRQQKRNRGNFEITTIIDILLYPDIKAPAGR